MHELDDLLQTSAADEAFKADVRAFAANHQVERVALGRHAPRVKVLRVLAHLLHEEPRLPITRVRIDGVAGCADYRGVVSVVAGDETLEWEFAWDCAWRAREAGLTDRYGLPDQTRAAREYGWRCFAVWAPRRAAAPHDG